MACFTLDETQKQFLAECISAHMDRVDTDESMEDAMGAICSELEESVGDMELTMVRA